LWLRFLRLLGPLLLLPLIGRWWLWRLLRLIGGQWLLRWRFRLLLRQPHGGLATGGRNRAELRSDPVRVALARRVALAVRVALARRVALAEVGCGSGGTVVVGWREQSFAAELFEQLAEGLLGIGVLEAFFELLRGDFSESAREETGGNTIGEVLE
jgi:hypothetical protein